MTSREELLALADELVEYAKDWRTRAGDVQPVIKAAKIQPAIDALINGQEQCDMDGVMVRVSRQALNEVLAFIQSAAHGDGTKSDRLCECSWGCVEATNCRRTAMKSDGASRP